MFSDHLSFLDKDSILSSESYGSCQRFYIEKEAMKGLYLSHLFLLLHLYQTVQDVSQ